MPQSLRLVLSSTFAFLAIGLVALLAIVGTTFWLGERSQAYIQLVNEARDTRTAAVELRSALQTAESSQRGYLLTGNEIYLSPFDVAKVNTQRQLSILERLVEPYPDATRPVQRLAGLVADKTAEMDQTVTLKRSRHEEDALAIIRSNKGKTLMDQANVFFSGIVRQAEDRLTAAVVEQRSNSDLLRLVSGIGGLIIVGVVGGAAFVLVRYTRELRSAQSELGVLNATLEQRVSERTSDLAQARDRAQLLLSEVNHRVANSLAMVSSLISMQSKGLAEGAAKHALSETQNRIVAISLVHKRLYSSTDVSVVSLDEYIAGLLDHLKTSLRDEGQSATLLYQLQPVQLATDASVSLGVVLTEWVTNAFKYAYPDGVAGEIRVSLAQSPDGEITLSVEDDGVGRVEGEPPKGTGLGTRIVTASAAGLGGRIDYVARSPGTAARLTFRAPQPRLPTASPGVA